MKGGTGSARMLAAQVWRSQGLPGFYQAHSSVPFPQRFRCPFTLHMSMEIKN